MKKTQTLVIAALMAAFTCVATLIIRFPTPTFGYIHLGDGLVLLCGILLGPTIGGLAAGIGSMFADIFGGYAVWAPSTLIIKGITAVIAGAVYNRLSGRRATAAADPHSSHGVQYVNLILSGVLAEAFMVIGYFFSEIIIALLGVGEASQSSFGAAAAASATGIPFNIIQGITGIVICTILAPILKKIPQVRELTAQR